MQLLMVKKLKHPLSDRWVIQSKTAGRGIFDSWMDIAHDKKSEACVVTYNSAVPRASFHVKMSVKLTMEAKFGESDGWWTGYFNWNNGKKEIRLRYLTDSDSIEMTLPCSLSPGTTIAEIYRRYDPDLPE